MFLSSFDTQVLYRITTIFLANYAYFKMKLQKAITNYEVLPILFLDHALEHD
jgi:hypothetical protein